MWYPSAKHEPQRSARGAIVFLLFLVSAPAAFAGGSHEAADAKGVSGLITVAAAEDFYGDVASQIAGAHATVVSLMSDPNIDPHEYESSVKDAVAVANADLVIENGGGYDTWIDKLLSASPSPSRIVVTGFDIAPTKLPENVHIWYNVDNMEAIGKAIRDALSKLDPADAADFDANFSSFALSLGQVRQKMAEIKARYPGTPIALTETVFLYQALPMGLAVLTPFAFQKAIAEGNDPPADSAVTAERQITAKKVRVLIYNAQTIDKLTTRLKEDARAAGIPVVPVTETMPPNLHYQTWMLDQLDRLERALAARGSEGNATSP